MTQAKTITIVVSPSGEAAVETHGFTGSECREASQFIEQALGRKSAETLKPEFHEDARERQDQRQPSFE